MVDQLTRPGDAARAGRLGRGVLAMLLFAVPVALLAFAVRQQFDPLVRADEDVIRAATDATRSAEIANELRVVQELSQPLWLYLLATAACVWAWAAKGLRNRAIWAFVTMMVSWNIGLLIKLLVQRARPVVDDPVSHSPGYSFPSGHAFNAAVVATAVVFLLWPLLRRTGHRISVALAVLGVLVVGLDRVFLGVHFPSDVLAGILLGGGITFSSWLGFIGRTPSTSSVGPSHPA
jgi:membrane-associated phospholipid phosphatase